MGKRDCRDDSANCLLNLRAETLAPLSACRMASLRRVCLARMARVALLVLTLILAPGCNVTFERKRVPPFRQNTDTDRSVTERVGSAAPASRTCTCVHLSWSVRDAQHFCDESRLSEHNALRLFDERDISLAQDLVAKTPGPARSVGWKAGRNGSSSRVRTGDAQHVPTTCKADVLL